MKKASLITLSLLIGLSFSQLGAAAPANNNASYSQVYSGKIISKFKSKIFKIVRINNEDRPLQMGTFNVSEAYSAKNKQLVLIMENSSGDYIDSTQLNTGKVL